MHRTDVTTKAERCSRALTVQYDPESPKGRLLAELLATGDYWVIVTDNFEAKNAVSSLQGSADEVMHKTFVLQFGG